MLGGIIFSIYFWSSFLRSRTSKTLTLDVTVLNKDNEPAILGESKNNVKLSQVGQAYDEMNKLFLYLRKNNL